MIVRAASAADYKVVVCPVSSRRRSSWAPVRSGSEKAPRTPWAKGCFVTDDFIQEVRAAGSVRLDLARRPFGWRTLGYCLMILASIVYLIAAVSHKGRRLLDQANGDMGEELFVVILVAAIVGLLAHLVQRVAGTTEIEIDSDRVKVVRRLSLWRRTQRGRTAELIVGYVRRRSTYAHYRGDRRPEACGFDLVLSFMSGNAIVAAADYPRAWVEALGNRIAAEVEARVDRIDVTSPAESEARKRMRARPWPIRVRRADQHEPPRRSRLVVSWSGDRVTIQSLPRPFLRWRSPALWVAVFWAFIMVVVTAPQSGRAFVVLAPFWLTGVVVVGLMYRKGFQRSVMVVTKSRLIVDERLIIGHKAYQWELHELEAIRMGRRWRAGRRPSAMDDGTLELQLAPVGAKEVVVMRMVSERDREWLCEVLNELVFGERE